MRRKKRFKGRCPSCRSRHLNWSSMWNGGWNYLCGQATSRSGWRCYDCGTFIWDQTDEEYAKSLPEWCKPN